MSPVEPTDTMTFAVYGNTDDDAFVFDRTFLGAFTVARGGPTDTAGVTDGVDAFLVNELQTMNVAAGHTPAPSGRHDHLHGQLSDGQVFLETSFREPALSAASQAGMVNNLNDGLAWGLFPVLFVAGGLSVAQIGVLAALYPAVWGLGQLVTGAMSDRYGRNRSSPDRAIS